MSKEECCTCSDRLNYVKLCEKYDQLESVHEVLVEDNLTYENQISDLETKLAESEKEIKEWIAVRDDKNNVINKQTEKINQLKQQLAEKDKIIEKLKSENHALMSDTAYQEADIFELTQKFAIHNQDKISFALEQLEKVKEFNIQQVFSSKPLDNFIDNQIKQLKEIE